MVGDGEILSKLFQYISHQLISVIQNIILRRSYREILKQSLFPDKPFFHIMSYFDAKDI